mgnify:CR=1 FL=1
MRRVALTVPSVVVAGIGVATIVFTERWQWGAALVVLAVLLAGLRLGFSGRAGLRRSDQTDSVTVDGGRSAGTVVGSGVVITGDGSTVTVQLREQTVVEVAVPDTVAGLERVLFDPVVGPDLSLVGSWLRPDAGVVVPEPRAEVEALVRWCTAERGPVVRLVCGAGGQGKTHLAGQVCQTLRDRGWLAGVVGLPSPAWQTVTQADVARGGVQGARARRDLRRVAELTAGVRAAVRLRVRTLLVVDYAENAAAVVAKLLDTIAEAGAFGWVRVLLLARSEVGWFDELAVEHRWHDWVHPQPMRLGALSQGWDADRLQVVWRRAVEAFARQARRAGLSVPAGLPQRVEVPRRGFETTLDLYAAALTAVLDAADGSGVGDAGGRDALVGVLRHEQRQVSARLRAEGLDVDRVGQAWAVAAVTLTIPATEAEAADVVGRLPGLAGLGVAERKRLVRALCGLYPDESRRRVWQAPRPDRLADVHLLELASRASSLRQWVDDLAAVCGGDGFETAVHAATVLRRCASTPDPDGLWRDGVSLVRDGLAGLVDRFPAGFVPAMVVVDPVGYEAQIVAAVEGRNGKGLDVAQVHKVDDLLQRLGFATTRTRVAVAVSQRLVAAARPGARWSKAAAHRYAGHLNNLSVRLADLGRHAEALTAAEESASIFRHLAKKNSDTHLPGLATSLTNLSSALRRAGRHTEALTSIEEAVTIYRRLAEKDPDTHQPGLAMALHNLSLALREVGRHTEALTAAEESASIFRHLAKKNSDTHLPGLTTSLTNLSLALRRVGRHTEALTTAEEAVTTYRRLAEKDPDTHQPDLAASLHNLSLALREVGRHTEALTTAEESVTTYRHLAKKDPDTHLPQFAKSLSNLSLALREVGRHTEALTTAEEAVTTYRRLAEKDPDTHQPDLAASLHNLSLALREVGRHTEALTTAEESVTTYRHLANNNPDSDSYLPDLAKSLHNLSLALREVGRHTEALTTAEESASIFRRLAKKNSDTHLLGLAASLHNLSLALRRVGRHTEALTTAEESVTTYRHLANNNPDSDSYLPDLAKSLHNLSLALREVGRHTEALAAIRESAAILRPLAREDPDTHLPEFAKSLHNLSLALDEVGRHAEALSTIQEATGIFRRLAREDPDTYLPDLAKSLHNLSLALRRVGRHAKALAAIRESAAILRRLAREDPDTHLPDLAASLHNLEQLLRRLGRGEEAKSIAQEARRLS